MRVCVCACACVCACVRACVYMYMYVCVCMCVCMCVCVLTILPPGQACKTAAALLLYDHFCHSCKHETVSEENLLHQSYPGGSRGMGEDGGGQIMEEGDGRWEKENHTRWGRGDTV